MKFKILIYFIFLSIVGNAQNKKPTIGFYRQTQVCHYSWATNYDYVINLYADSTIRLVTYAREYKGQRKSITRNEYFGNYSFQGDTINIQYLSKNEKRKLGVEKGASLQKLLSLGTKIYLPKQDSFTNIISKTQKDTLFNIESYQALFYPPAKFIFNSKILVPLEASYPNIGLLEKNSIEIEMLEKEFSTWCNTTIFKSKFNPPHFDYLD
jgi:hypothetical protein